MVFGLKNCCSDSGFVIDHDLGECSEDGGSDLAWAGQAYVSNRCSKKPCSGPVCAASGFCTFNSRLGRILQEHARSQLGISWDNSCRGLSVEELERMDWQAVDLSEVIGDITGRLTEPEEANSKRFSDASPLFMSG